MISKYYYLLACALLISCQTGKLVVVADIPSSLKEVSAIETLTNSDLFWVIEDSGNKNIVYGLNTKGGIDKSITITNAENKDWEDLTTDSSGHLYVGDFGNNSKKRETFSIYKIAINDTIKQHTQAELIQFSFPEKGKTRDFESFFLWNNSFYLFSKDDKKCHLYKIPNVIGNHTAEFISAYKFNGKSNKITSADISDDGKTVALLTHSKLWKLSHFKGDDFFSGTIEALDFDHTSQKEGVCFKNNKALLITEESSKNVSSNTYLFNLN